MTHIPPNVFLFNTLTRQKQRFSPMETGKVHMYTCGPTVYDYAHIGNFRAFVFEDILKRWLKFRGFRVTHVMNLTDVDDKTIKGARTREIPLRQYTDFYAKAFFEDANTLNIEPADLYPRATEHVPEMVELIKTLLTKGFAYKGEDGSTYFAISKFHEYGKLSKIQIQDLKAGARVNVDEYSKEEAQDFALWKAWTPEDGDVYWDSELGKGRPGWHIECSAMSMKYLGDTFDIHCGGVDNIFPHHENEIAQSEAATGKPFVRYWLHNEHLLVEGRRMAKSLGNYYTLRDLVEKGCDPMAIRFLLLSTHYRQQLNFTFESLEAAESATKRFSNVMRRTLDANGAESGKKLAVLIRQVEMCFCRAMDDDLNVSVALASLFDFVRAINNLLDTNQVSKQEAAKIYSVLSKFNSVIGVVGETETPATISERAKELIAKREEARRAKEWRTADDIRLQLEDLGIVLEDTPQGVRWRIRKPS